MNIRRYYSPGQIVFITQVVKNRRPLFADDSMIDLLRQVLHAVQEYHPFSMIAYVFLPDHFHLLIKPEGNSNFSQIMHSIKRNITFEYKREKHLKPPINLWQSRFWDHVIRDERDYENHVHYIHLNPIKHGFAEELSGWRHSSYFDWYQRGDYEGWERWEEPGNVSWGE